jgi:hypothetical protein
MTLTDHRTQLKLPIDLIDASLGITELDASALKPSIRLLTTIPGIGGSVAEAPDLIKNNRYRPSDCQYPNPEYEEGCT